ncbi:MAG: hypothetical protein Q8P37_00950 [Candidatus Spechtbacteria bacterium]|nr:hypothetical protein [Candidatus Spechtbacteria bacterium]
MKFPYKKYGELVGAPVYRPVIPVELRYRKENVKYEVLVDSGADLCIFHKEIGELLGMEIEKGKKEYVIGINGGREIFYVHSLTLNVGGWDYKIEAGFKDMSKSGYGVVGQTGFFDKFVVKFKYGKKEVELTPVVKGK